MKNLALHLTFFFTLPFFLFTLASISFCLRSRGVHRAGCGSFPTLFNILWNRYFGPLSCPFTISIQFHLFSLSLTLFSLRACACHFRYFVPSIPRSEHALAGIQNAQLFENSVLEYKRNQILLNLARSIFEEQNNLECLVKKIMREARDLLKCERCAVFLVDLECCEAVSGRHHNEFFGQSRWNL